MEKLILQSESPSIRIQQLKDAADKIRNLYPELRIFEK